MKKINVSKISSIVSELCIDANYNLRRDIKSALKTAVKKETQKSARNIIQILLKNAQIAGLESRALCQDTGIVSVYVELGQEVRLFGGDLENAVNEGVKRAYKEGFLRKSIVRSPMIRVNTCTNTPAVIHTEIVKGDRLKISVMPKGFGSENKSKIKMLNPTAGDKEIISFVLDVVKEAGPDGCPPYILGIGIGGTFDKAAFLAKKAFLMPINKNNPKK
ncbi:MAG: fumarate hydratase, partial [Candidatus Omnitrophota bacterium]